MVAYSFKTRFAGQIISGCKRQTIRMPRKRHAYVGEQLQLYTGMRTRSCIKLGTAECLEVRSLVLDFKGDRIVLDDAIQLDTSADLNAFATLDGFGDPPNRLSPWGYLCRWWRLTHEAPEQFHGVLIGWGETFAPNGREAA